MDIARLHQLFLAHPRISTDTRKIEGDSLFFALRGPNFNGNAFAREALDKGASHAIIDDPDLAQGERTILVPDVLQTLQHLATYHRNHCKARVICLTGSNGKTTTKELIHAVLSQTHTTIATMGNLNNHIGVPLTLLQIRPETEIAIVEMGANHQKEIAQLSEIAQPDFGYITNFGKAHLEGFGGVEGVIKGKSELYDYLITHGKGVFLNADDPIQKEKLASYISKYGYSQDDHQYSIITFLRAEPYLSLAFEDTEIHTQLTGAYNFPNCCAALLMGRYFNVPLPKMKAALESYRPQNNRSQIVEIGGHTIVLDAYNANPTSMQAALESFAQLEAGTKHLFLGDMFELGTDAANEHQFIADLAKDLGFTNVHLVGTHFSGTDSSYPKVASFDKLKETVDFQSLPKGHILIKGSRGMAMERILDLL